MGQPLPSKALEQGGGVSGTPFAPTRVPIHLQLAHSSHPIGSSDQNGYGAGPRVALRWSLLSCPPGCEPHSCFCCWPPSSPSSPHSQPISDSPPAFQEGPGKAESPAEEGRVG